VNTDEPFQYGRTLWNYFKWQDGRILWNKTFTLAQLYLYKFLLIKDILDIVLVLDGKGIIYCLACG
jgi:hypothetical protein